MRSLLTYNIYRNGFLQLGTEYFIYFCESHPTKLIILRKKSRSDRRFFILLLKAAYLTRIYIPLSTKAL